MTPTEMSFDETPVDPDKDQEPEAPEPEAPPQEEPEPQDEIQEIKGVLAELVEWARSQQAPAATQAAAPPSYTPRPKPAAIASNEVASALWDRVEEIDAANQQRYENAQRAEQDRLWVENQFNAVTQMAEKHTAERVRAGDPQVSADEVMQTIQKMGLLRNPNVSYEEGVKLAYNAVAFDAAKGQARTQGVRDATRPTARVPAPYNPSRPRQTVSREPTLENGQPTDKQGRLKAAAEKSLREFSRLSPEEREQAFGL